MRRTLEENKDIPRNRRRTVALLSHLPSSGAAPVAFCETPPLAESWRRLRATLAKRPVRPRLGVPRRRPPDRGTSTAGSYHGHARRGIHHDVQRGSPASGGWGADSVPPFARVGEGVAVGPGRRERGPATRDQERHCGFRIADCGMEGQGPSQGAFSGEPQATARPWLAASHVGRRAPRVLRPILWAFAPRERGIASAF